MQEIADLARVLSCALVERPGEVRVREQRAGDETLLELTCAPDDRGRIIGRQGATVQALRVLLGAAAKRRGQRCHLEILD